MLRNPSPGHQPGSSRPPVALAAGAFSAPGRSPASDLFSPPPQGIFAQRAPRACFVHLDDPVDPLDRYGILATAYQPAVLPLLLRGAGKSVAVADFWGGFFQQHDGRVTTPSAIVVSALPRPPGDERQRLVRERVEQIASAFGCVLLFVTKTQRGLEVSAGQAHQRSFRPVS